MGDGFERHMILVPYVVSYVIGGFNLPHVRFVYVTRAAYAVIDPSYMFFLSAGMLQACTPMPMH